MSMSYELMMRKKEEIMYATIKGTLTENDGVFSGFSASNYLKLQQAIPNLDISSNFEILIKTTMPDVSNTVFVLGDELGNNSDINIRITTAKRIYGYIYDDTNSNRIYTTIPIPSSLQEGYDLYIKYSISGGKLAIKCSSDNINWVESSIDLPSDFAYTKGLLANIGGGAIGFASLSGSIDLPNSYIKLGSTKYNLQAVVGYTIVGSPTITDGVVSGFSNSSYLSLPSIKNTDISEVCIKIKIPSSKLGLNKYTSFITGAIQMTVYSSTSKFTYAGVNTSGLGDIYFNIPNNISPDTDYWLKFVNKGTKCQTFWSLDGIDFNLGATKDNTITVLPNIINIGGNGSRFFEGIIDLNETYIKTNNKLWFNGQQA